MKELIILIDDYLGGKITYDSFYSEFNNIYCIEPSIFEEEEEEFVSNINDKLAYATENPDDVDRKDGLVSASEFKKWLEYYKVKNIHFWKENKKYDKK